MYLGGGENEKEYLEFCVVMELVVEIFQYKGDSECCNGFDDVDVEVDLVCDFEKLRLFDDSQCGEEIGIGGMCLWGCVYWYDFVRNVFKMGFFEVECIGVNFYWFGFIGSIDIYNGMLGNVSSVLFSGYVGLVDDILEKCFGFGTVMHDGLINNLGGFVVVWVEENTCEVIFVVLM